MTEFGTADLIANRAGVVLAGGLSTRMGTDKSTLVVDGQRLIDRSLLALERAGVAPLFVALNAQPGTDIEITSNAEVVHDMHGSMGPMSGIVSTWEHITERLNSKVEALAVLSCDLPRIQSSLIDELIRAASQAPDGAVAHDGQSVQPLVAVYRRSALDDIVRSWHEGERSVRRLFARWSLAVVHADAQAIDADEPSDLKGHHVDWPAGHQVHQGE